MVLVPGVAEVPWASQWISIVLAACHNTPSVLRLRAPYSASSPVLGSNALPWWAVCWPKWAACGAWLHGERHGCQASWLHCAGGGGVRRVRLFCGTVTLSLSGGMMVGPGSKGGVGSTLRAASSSSLGGMMMASCGSGVGATMAIGDCSLRGGAVTAAVVAGCRRGVFASAVGTAPLITSIILWSAAL